MIQPIEDVTELILPDGRVGRPRVDFAFMKPRLSRWLSLGFGSGLSRFAPGTAGTLFAWVTFAVLHRWVGDVGIVFASLACFAAGLWAVERCGRDLGAIDHGAIVIDEIIAFWLVLLVVPVSFNGQFLAFITFRFFDIVKPPPIRWLEQRFHNAFGVLIDDLAAAAWSIVLMLIWTRF